MQIWMTHCACCQLRLPQPMMTKGALVVCAECTGDATCMEDLRGIPYSLTFGMPCVRGRKARLTG